MAFEARHRPLIVPVFIPHAGCPHRCAFCDQAAITGSTLLPTAATVHDTVKTWRARSRHADRPIQVAFYGGNFLGIRPDAIASLMDAAAAHVSAEPLSGIRFSTRPDTICPDRLAAIASYPVAMVELGVQSLDNDVLSASRRGHDAKTAVTAVRHLAAAGYRVGVQLMVGLPGDTAATAMATARQVAALRPDAVRIYPTIVLKNSLLAHWMARGRYHPWRLEATVALVADMVHVFASTDIPVIRMGLHADDGLQGADAIVAGPYHPAFGHLVQSHLFHAALRREMNRRRPLPGRVSVGVHPRSRSRAGGWRNTTVTALQLAFSVELNIIADAALGEDQLWVDHHPPVSVFS
jgi:histone acetyltransferase (RNA polymerase elongator complex component)